jgi:5-epi-alpha-selinene synthase
MQKPSLPAFFCPFQPQINEFVDQIHYQTLNWAVKTRYVSENDLRYERLNKARFAWLTALTQPYSQLEDLKLAADWHTWLFAHDDIVDASAVGRSPEQIKTIHIRLNQILDGEEPDKNDNGIAYALADIRCRVTARTNPFWAERFFESVKQYFQGNNWEAINRQEKVTPDLTTYVKIRQFSGAVFSCFNLIFLTLELSPRAQFLNHIYIQQLAVMANHHICWVNDIIGLEKEIREKNRSNLVLVLQEMYQSTLDEAVRTAVAYCDQEMAAFIKLEERLPDFGPTEGPQVEAYLTALKAWMSGHIQWYRETGRYLEPK